jgi:hypothetical protein
MVSALAVFAGLLVIYLLLIPGMRKQDRRFRSGRRPMRTLTDLSQAGSAESAAEWVTTFVGLLALSSLLSSENTVGSSTGAALGVFCGVLTISRGLSTLRDWILSGIGIIAAFAGVAQVLAGNECGGTYWHRATMLTVTILAFAVGLAISLIRFSLTARVGLQAFVVVEIVTFLAAPIGVDLVGGAVWIAIAAALAFGLLVGVSPVAVFSLVGIGLGVVTLWASTQTFDGCSMDGDYNRAVVVVSGIVTFFLASAVVSVFRR